MANKIAFCNQRNVSNTVLNKNATVSQSGLLFVTILSTQSSFRFIDTSCALFRPGWFGKLFGMSETRTCLFRMCVDKVSRPPELVLVAWPGIEASWSIIRYVAAVLETNITSVSPASLSCSQNIVFWIIETSSGIANYAGVSLGLLSGLKFVDSLNNLLIHLQWNSS